MTGGDDPARRERDGDPAAPEAALPALDYRPPEGPLAVLHRDDDLLLVDKPSGLLSVPGKTAALRDCLEARVRATYPQALTVHRLDLGTSGVMVFAMNRRAQRILGGQFERRIVRKTYHARVAGRLAEDEGRIDLPLTADWPLRPKQRVCHRTGRAAVTIWRVLAREAGTSLLDLRPETGRSHQLRVHLQAIGHPILGDALYDSGETREGVSRLQLHATELSLRHPADGSWFRCRSPRPF